MYINGLGDCRLDLSIDWFHMRLYAKHEVLHFRYMYLLQRPCAEIVLEMSNLIFLSADRFWYK